MPRMTFEGQFYAFDRSRPQREIGPLIGRNQALFRLQAGADVYTPRASDAMSLAKDVHPGKAGWEGAHSPSTKKDWDFDLPTNRRYPHFHPGGIHQVYGHVFYGNRGYRVDEKRR